GEHTEYIGGDPSGARHAGPSGSPEQTTGTVPILVLCSPRAHLRHLLRRSYLRLVLLLLHPLGPVHLDLDRYGQLPDVLRGAGPDHRPAQHLDLCGAHLRNEGGPRHGSGPAVDLEDHRSRLLALSDLLPGAGEHHRRWTHLHCVDEPGAGTDQPGAGRSRCGRAGLADEPQPGVVLHRLGGRVEGCRAGHGHLHRRAGLHPPGVLRGSGGRRGQQMAGVQKHHAATGQAGHRHRDHAVTHRRPAVVRPDLGDDQGRTGFCVRRHRVDDLQAVPGRVLWALHGGQCGAVPGRHDHRGPAHLVAQSRGASL
ncbi:MAG: Predicted rhamnose oligosaccharide ABC transport system, permease component, partial [uncultured Propionibacteriaceae bacterium]